MQASYLVVQKWCRATYIIERRARQPMGWPTGQLGKVKLICTSHSMRLH